MIIAFASKDGVKVDEHFGWSKKFYFYKIVDNSYEFYKEVDSSKKLESEVDKLTYKIETLEDTNILYVLQIGPKASTMVKSAGIMPLKSSSKNELIEDVLKKIIELKNGNPPLWMRRFISGIMD